MVSEGKKALNHCVNFPATEITDGFVRRSNCLPGQIARRKANIPSGFRV